MEKTKVRLKTDAMNKWITVGMNQLQVANEEDHFRRLPKEALVNIFSRLADLKSLCRYSLVSKHFTKGVRTVSVKLSGSVTYTEQSLKISSTLLRVMQPFGAEEIRQLLGQFDFSGRQKFLRNLNLPSFLQKLTDLESICLDYEYPQQDGKSYSFPMSKMNFVDGKGPKIKGVVSLVPAGPDSIRLDCCAGGFFYGGKEYFEKASVEQMNRFWLRYYGRYSEWYCLALMLAKSHASLSMVTITDSGMDAKLVMEYEMLAKFANTGYALEELDYQVGNNIVRLARIPILHLPLSGYVMRWACLVIIHAPDVDLCASAEKLDQVMFADCGEEFERLREVVSEVFENHGDELQLWGSHTAFRAQKY